MRLHDTRRCANGGLPIPLEADYSIEVIAYTLAGIFLAGAVRTLLADVPAERKAKREFERLYGRESR